MGQITEKADVCVGASGVAGDMLINAATHLRVVIKLDVSNRSATVRRGRELGPR